MGQPPPPPGSSQSWGSHLGAARASERRKGARAGGGVECELGHACPSEPPGPGGRQKLLGLLTPSGAKRENLCDVPGSDGRAQGRVAAGRSVIPTDKRGSLSRTHKAAGRGLGLGRLHRSARRGGTGLVRSGGPRGASSAPRPPRSPRPRGVPSGPARGPARPPPGPQAASAARVPPSGPELPPREPLAHLPAARARSPQAVAAPCTRRNFISSSAAGQALGARSPGTRMTRGRGPAEGRRGRACASAMAEAWLLPVPGGPAPGAGCKCCASQTNPPWNETIIFSMDRWRPF